MSIRTYARVADGMVVEFLNTTADISAIFHRDLRWIDATDVAGIAYGWTYDGASFAAPVPVVTQPPAE